MRARTSVSRFLGSVAASVAIAVVAPWLLVLAARARFGGPTPWHGVPAPASWEWPTIRRALTEQLTDDTVADVVVRAALAIAWATVAVLLVTIVAEAAHMVRHGGLAMPDVRGLGPAQPIARVVAAGLLVVVPTVATAAGGLEAAGPALVTPPEVADEPSHLSDVGRRAVDDAEQRDAAPRGLDRHVVRAGDSVYAIAERRAGPDADAVVAYAERIVELNLGREMPDGRRFENAALVHPGWVLDLPDPPAHEPAPRVRPGLGGEPGEMHVVEAGDTLWSIAGDELDDPSRWPEIYDANRGRTFADGQELDDPETIQPGWELVVPAEVRAPTTAGDPVVMPSEPRSSDIPVETGVEQLPGDGDVGPGTDPADPGDTEAAVTATPDDGTRRVDPTDPTAPAGTDAAGTDPAGIEPAGGARPTNRWIGPALGRPVAGATTPTSAPTSGHAARPDPVTADLLDEAGPRLLTLGRAAMLSAGLLAVLGVRRRRQLRRAGPRSELPTPPPVEASTERLLRSLDDGDRFLRVTHAVRSAAGPLVDAGERVVAVLVDDDGALELIASGPARLDAPWVDAPSVDERGRWRLPGTVSVEVLDASARQVATPCPTLVQLGRTPDERDLYVDLEALGAVEIGGPGDQAQAIVTGVAATLAGSVLAEVVSLVAVGVDDAAFLGHRHHVPAYDTPDAFRRAVDAVGSTSASGRSTFELRTRVTGGEAWEPAVVLVGAAAGTVVPPADRSALAVVSASPIHGPSSRLEPDGDAWILRPLGVRLVPAGLTAAELAGVSALVDATEADLPISPGAVAPDDDLTLLPAPEVVCDGRSYAAPSEEAGDDDRSCEAPPLLVRLLGPVGIESADGRSAAFARSKSEELVAWLATHRDRSTRAAARTALWELDVRDATFANVVSEARRTLARLVDPPDGEEWVGRTLTEALPLHPLVRTDADLLRVALDAARDQPPGRAIATLRPAVELVVGVPFEGTDYLWPEAEGIASQLVLLATSAAAELAAHHLSAGDIDGVFEATGRGLRVLPGHEGLVGCRMRAHAEAGDRAGVRHEWEQYERVVNADPWSDGEPSPSLVELRRELLAR